MIFRFQSLDDLLLFLCSLFGGLYWSLQSYPLKRRGTQSTTSSTILYFKKMPTNKKKRYLLFIIERKTVYHWTPRKQSSKLKKWTLSLWTRKPNHFVESVLVRSIFLVQIFSRIWTKYGDLQSKSPYITSNHEILEKSKAEYQEALSNSGYSTKSSYTNSLTVTTLATGTAIPRLFLTMTQIKTKSAI